MNARKGLSILALLALAGCAFGGDKDRPTDSLFLSSDAFMAPKNQASRVPQMEVDERSDDSSVTYSLAPQNDWDPHCYTLTIGNCAAVLGIIGMCGGLMYFRDRLFSAYR